MKQFSGIKPNKSLLLFATQLFICLIIAIQVNSEVVCSEDELVKELIEDIQDNGKLDCLRESSAKKNESAADRELRIKANWNSDCSFESGDSWVKRLEKNYPIHKGLIDVDGNSYLNNKPDQADMCEIIRTLIGNGLFKGYSDVTNLTTEITQLIDCPGLDDTTQVCAATPSSFLDKKSWYIFLDGQGISVDSNPEYVLTSWGDSNSQAKGN